MPTRISWRQYELIHEIYVLLDDCDRRLLSPFRLNPSHFRLMMNLSDYGGERLTTLSRRLLLSKSSVTRIVDQLEHMGWVRRAADAGDRRAQRVVLTPEGERIRSDVADLHQRSLEQRMESLAAPEQQELGLLLGKLSAGLRELLETGGLQGAGR